MKSGSSKSSSAKSNPQKSALQGRSHIKLDAKGRLHLPTRFGDSLKNERQLVITNSVHAGQRFLDVYPAASWQKLVSQISNLPQLRPEVQSFQRYYISSGEAVDLDSQGRFLIPGHFREFAHFQNEVVVIGAGSKLEIWASEHWNKLLHDLEGRFDDIVRSIAEMTENSANRRKGGS